MTISRIPLLWRNMLSTSLAITALLAVVAFVVEKNVTTTATESLEESVRAGIRAYQSNWQARAEMLGSVSALVSSMTEVRASFSTRDQATIRDTAGEIWSRIAKENALFLVVDPNGSLVASLGGQEAPKQLSVVADAASKFPSQAQGFLVQKGKLYQVVVTPVYVQSPQGNSLLNVLVAGFPITADSAARLKQDTNSDYVLTAEGQVVASTLPDALSQQLASASLAAKNDAEPGRVKTSRGEYAAVDTDLRDVAGKKIGRLRAVRTLATVTEKLAALHRNLIALWLLSIAAGVGVSAVLAKSMLKPIKRLEQAANEVSAQNYDQTVPVTSNDELGRLAEVFNRMIASIRQAREDLIQQERVSAVGRMAASIVHDLRNPLSVIYGGSELLMQEDMPEDAVKEIAVDVYRGAGRLKELLDEMTNLAGGHAPAVERCSLREVAEAAMKSVSPLAHSQGVEVHMEIPSQIELSLERKRMQRVFSNLFMNAIESMPNGGELRTTAVTDKNTVIIQVEDTGPGVPKGMQERLFKPFNTDGKKDGLGLGLALARQAVLDHGGDLWSVPKPGKGARFCIRLSQS